MIDSFMLVYISSGLPSLLRIDYCNFSILDYAPHFLRYASNRANEVSAASNLSPQPSALSPIALSPSASGFPGPKCLSSTSGSVSLRFCMRTP